VATFGIDYNGARISPFERYPGMRDSAWHWTPSIGPSGLAYLPAPDAEAEGTFYLGGLAIPGLYAAERRGDQILAVEQRFPELTERIRDVRVARDGTLLVLTDGEKGRLLRLQL
jgi:glucose/arabinose dehydrogenase